VYPKCHVLKKNCSRNKISVEKIKANKLDIVTYFCSPQIFGKWRLGGSRFEASLGKIVNKTPSEPIS
jgi:hypothetical protein